MQALVHPGDEVILFDPSYDSYAPAVLLAGGRPIHIPLQPPHFQIDWERVRQRCLPRTRLVMLNTPHNPTATDRHRVGSRRARGPAAADRRRWCSSDEVYEHMIFDGARHASIVAHPELYERGVAVFSFGKTMHATGWRVGYTVAPAEITREIRRVHQFNTFSIAAPLQHAIADFLKASPRAQRRARRVLSAQARSVPRLPAQLQLQLDAGGRHLLPAARFQRDLAAERRGVRRHAAARGRRRLDTGLAFLCQRRRSSRVLRFCFAKNDSTLEEAAEAAMRRES